jgi:hypothetical protein
VKRPLRFNIYMLPCAKCGGKHATWWKTVPPPSCEERQRAAKS